MTKTACCIAAFLIFLASDVKGQICDSNNLIDGTTYLLPGVAKYSSYLQIFADLVIPCDGVITQWGIVQNAGGYNQPVYLDIWRPFVSGTIYSLVGSNRIIPTSTVSSVQTFIIPATQQITVQTGDVIGLHYDSYATPVASRVVPYLDPENAQATSATRVWRLQENEIVSRNSTVNVSDAIVANQRRLPGLLAYVTTASSTSTSVSPSTSPSTPVTIPSRTQVPIIQISVGGFGFNWPALNTPPSIIFNAASSLIFITPLVVMSKTFAFSLIVMFLAQSFPTALCQSTTISMQEQVQAAAKTFVDLEVNGVKIWVITLVVSIVLLLIIIILLICVCRAYSNRSKRSKGTLMGYYGNMEMFTQTEFHPVLSQRGVTLDASTMTKKSLFTEPPPPARKSEDYYRLRADDDGDMRRYRNQSQPTQRGQFFMHLNGARG